MNNDGRGFVQFSYALTPMEMDGRIMRLESAIRAALSALGDDPQAELRIYKARTILSQAIKS